MTTSYADPTCALDDHPQPRQLRLRRDLRIEHTVYTSDGVCLAVRDYQPHHGGAATPSSCCTACA